MTLANPIIFIGRLIKGLKMHLATEWQNALIVQQHPSCRLHSNVRIDAASRLERYNVLFSNTTLINSTLGDHSYVQAYALLYQADVGRYCSIASGAQIGLPPHDITWASSHPVFGLRDTPLVQIYRCDNGWAAIPRTTLGHDVWVGHGALITAGVHVGHGAVIAAGAVVTRDVPPYAIVAGVPARLIRFRFEEDVRQRLLDAAWWDRGEEWISRHADTFVDPATLLAALDESQEDE